MSAFWNMFTIIYKRKHWCLKKKCNFSTFNLMLNILDLIQWIRLKIIFTIKSSEMWFRVFNFDVIFNLIAIFCEEKCSGTVWFTMLQIILFTIRVYQDKSSICLLIIWQNICENVFPNLWFTWVIVLIFLILIHCNS